MKDQQQESNKKENMVLYIVYATAAYFGLQLLFKSNRSQPVITSPDKVAGPPPVNPVIIAPVPGIKIKPAAPAWTAESFPLRKGMKGAKVKAVQQKLGITADGAFGTQTEVAVIKKYGVATVSSLLFQSITKPLNQNLDELLLQAVTGKDKVAANNTAVLKQGSQGPDVYRLQKWLGFKDKKEAVKGQPVADSIFGKQTLDALYRKTGQATITLNQFQIVSRTGVGAAGETIITKKPVWVLDNNMLPYRQVAAGTLLGTKLMELTDPQEQKKYTQFRAMNGFRGWVDRSAV